tara:strand:- start:624 stop:1259 length:636 start_codon:yes stop_codon:yes gene_type:complete
MWALVEDNAIIKIINNPKTMVIGDVRHSKNIFSFRWTNEEREAIGIYEIVFDNSNKKDEEYYINTNQSFDYSDGQVIASYGTATPKQLTDINWTQEQIDDPSLVGKAPEGADTDTVRIEGLKTIKIRQVKEASASILQKTDWYVVRKSDAGTAIPSAITNYRASIRIKSNEMETSINNASDVPALETLYTYTTNDAGVTSRPLGEFPILES